MTRTPWTTIYLLTAAVFLAILAFLLLSVPRDEGEWLWTDQMVQGGWMAWSFPVALFFWIIAATLPLCATRPSIPSGTSLSASASIVVARSSSAEMIALDSVNSESSITDDADVCGLARAGSPTSIHARAMASLVPMRPCRAPIRASRMRS